MFYWAAERMFSRYDWALMEIPFVFINSSLLKRFWQKVKVKTWQCCLKRKPRVITFLSTSFGLRFRQDFRYQLFSYLLFYLHLLGISCFSFTRYVYAVHIRKKLPSTKHQKVQIFSRLLRLRCCNFCLLNILLFLRLTLSYMTTMFDTVHVSAISNISVPGNVFVSVIVCLKYTVIPIAFYDGVNNLRALCHTSGS
jgi:hypothetical protein